MRIFDNIIMLGEGIPLDFSNKIESAFQALAVEGRHATIVTNMHDLANLISTGKIQSYTRIDIVAHGSKDSDFRHYLTIPEGGSLTTTAQKKHFKTEEVFRVIANLNVSHECWDGVQIHLWSCYGGISEAYLDILPEGAASFVHSTSYAPIFFSSIETSLIQALHRKVNPFIEYMYVVSDLTSYGLMRGIFSYVNERNVDNKKSCFHKNFQILFLLEHPQELKTVIISHLQRYQQSLFHRLSGRNIFKFSPQKSIFESTILEISASLTEEKLLAYWLSMLIEAVLFGNTSSSKDDPKYFKLYFDHAPVHPDDLQYGKLYLVHLIAFAMNNGKYATDLWQYLLSLRVNLNKQDDTENGFFPIHYLVFSNNLPGIRFLLEHQADVDAISRGGLTSLMMAAEKGYLQIVQVLLNAGANPMLGNKSALALAERHNHTEIVFLLREAIRKKQPGAVVSVGLFSRLQSVALEERPDFQTEMAIAC